MIRIFLPLICAALGLAAASCSQTEGPFAPAEAPASLPATPHEAASAAMANPLDPPPAPASGTAEPSNTPSPASGSQPAAPAASAASSAPPAHRASAVIGMPVVSADGSLLGEVKDIIFDSQGRATHVVIACDGQSQVGKLAAVPWDTVIARITDGRVVLDRANLQGAPSFTPQEWPNLDDPAWSATTDAYWRKVARPRVVAHPGNPIDSTARLRGRPARDGN